MIGRLSPRRAGMGLCLAEDEYAMGYSVQFEPVLARTEAVAAETQDAATRGGEDGNLYWLRHNFHFEGLPCRWVRSATPTALALAEAASMRAEA